MVLLVLGGREMTYGQVKFSLNPLDAAFVTRDYDKFWQVFDKLDSTNGNPFGEYLDNASEGLKPFVDYLDVEQLYQTVLTRKQDYLKSRHILNDLESKSKRVRASYAALKFWYPEAKFPPVYFIMGRFTSGGTASENGLIVGTEMLESLDGLVGLIAHELIHYQQDLSGNNSLLEQAIAEGSADFIGELISGEHINLVPFRYGTEHEERLCREFVDIMTTDKYTDWLYGTSGKDDRPNDLGYWMGYKISEAFFAKQEDKKHAIHEILNFKDSLTFVKQSGYLDRFMAK